MRAEKCNNLFLRVFIYNHISHTIIAILLLTLIFKGIYYKPNSLKAKFCVEGKKLLYEYLKERKIPFNKCGKLLVATNDNEVNYLEKIMKRAQANGVNDLSIIDSYEVSKLEPEVKCSQAILSPSTGVFDSSTYVQNLVADIENYNGNVIYNCSVDKIKKNKNLFEILTNQGTIECDIVINASGMHAPLIASKTDQYPTHLIPKQFYSKGNYFKIENGQKPNFKRLVYPIPNNGGGLGIHLTIDFQNNVRFGPDSEWLMPITSHTDSDLIDHQYIFHEPPSMSAFQVSAERSTLFYDEIKKYWPMVSETNLVPDFAGIRPMLCGPSGTTNDDFLIETKSQHNIENLINLYGITSPGLTSSLAIGNHVKNYLINV